MFSIATISHKTDETRQPLIMLTNREGFKYFFGKVPEGTQRVLNENRVKLGRLKTVFLTGTLSSWSDIGGLPGLFLTLSDSTKKGIEVFSNSSKVLSYIVATWRGFVFRKGVALTINDTVTEGIIADNNLSIKPILIANDLPPSSYDDSLSDKLSSQLKKLTSLMFPLDTTGVNDINPLSYKLDRTETEVHTHVKLPSPELVLPAAHQKSTNYLIRLLPMRGKFDPVKAKALGLKPGVSFRHLSQGLSVTNELGETIVPEQVIEPSKPFPKILILDIPDRSYLQPTINSPEWFEKDTDKGDEDIGLVYHLLGDEVDFKTKDYQDFLAKFPINTTHIISHSSIADNTLVFRRFAVNTLMLKSVQNDHFNLPAFEDYRPLESNKNTHKLQQLQQLHITSDGVKLDESGIRDDTWTSLYDDKIEPLNLAGADKKEILHSKSIPLTMVKPDLNDESTSLKNQVQIVTLGTGSAIPSLYRNVISTLIRVPYQDEQGNITTRSILLDGGENTLGTILRNYPDPKELAQVFQELDLIHLSHLHADHHLGILSVINKWFEFNQNTSKKLYLVVPWQYRTFVQEWYKLESNFNPVADQSRLVYLSCEEFIQERDPEYEPLELEEFERRFDCQDLHSVIPKQPLPPRDTQTVDQFFKDTNITSVQTVRALHCYWAYSISIDLKLSETETFKVSYSGDTRPNPKFVDIGYCSDLLVHESSLDNDLIEEALTKKHSTMIEAISMSKYMNCPKVILTHFSTRYSNKTDIATNPERLEKLAKDLDAYLVKYSSVSNIFVLERLRRQVKQYGDLEICYAFDMMSVRYGDVNCQKQHQDVIGQIFSTEDDGNEEKREKEAQKITEKRDAKRLQRLNLKVSKRRKSP